MPESAESPNVPAQPAPSTTSGAPPSPPVPPQDGATGDDDGRTRLARLVGALLLLAPLLLIYLLIALWPRPQGSIQCEPANQESPGSVRNQAADSGAASSAPAASAARSAQPAGTPGTSEGVWEIMRLRVSAP
jgi:hypothetical protein